MGKRFSVTRAFCGRLLVLALAVTASSPRLSGEGYLAKTGPVPLRFRIEKPPGTALRLPPLPKDAAPVATITNEISQTNSVDSQISFNGSPVLPSASSDPSLFNGMSMPPFLVPQGEYPTNSASGPGSANDLLNITPQMFVEYFRPAPGLTNGAGVSVSVPVGFMPPPPPVSPGSKATYISQ
jgi:hypothetical protein